MSQIICEKLWMCEEITLTTVFCVLILTYLVSVKCHQFQDTENTLEKPTVEKCFGDLGCFNLDYPWLRTEPPFSVLPDDPKKINTTFYLSTRSDGRMLLTTVLTKLLVMTDFNPESWTVFIVHGFQSSAHISWVHDMENALLHIGDVNVISCDWENGSKGDYSQAMANSRVVAAEISRLSQFLISRNLISSRKMYLIGHGIGAHITSYVGSTIKSVERITGLDPAQYGFENAHPDTRLDESDATFVDVIHTNTEPFHPLLGVGMKETVGHVDFYINDGQFQPGCPERDVINVEYINNNVALILSSLGCNHMRAVEYYIESLESNCSFWGHKRPGHDNEVCSPSTCQRMGLYTNLYPARGTFYVYTHNATPFCITEYQSDMSMAHMHSKKASGWNSIHARS